MHTIQQFQIKRNLTVKQEGLVTNKYTRVVSKKINSFGGLVLAKCQWIKIYEYSKCQSLETTDFLFRAFPYTIPFKM